MPTQVMMLRALSLLASAAPALLRLRQQTPQTAAPQSGAARLPVVANLAASAVFFPSLLIGATSSDASAALLLALSGCCVSIAGAALVVWSRVELGAAWSFAPKADSATGPVTTGPYRLVRHPIYLGFVLLTLGQALAFGSWLACGIVFAGIVPSFAWRARAEETLLSHTFGERYEAYRQQTKLIIPYLF
jgi:protein-S-isoprenylcysteine O-methyltransferase Ste14